MSTEDIMKNDLSFERLTGDFKHYCPEWDGLAIDETCVEFEACVCYTPEYSAEVRKRKWDRRYLKLAQEVASWSKDPSTKVGAVLVNPRFNCVVATGFNGFPAGMSDRPSLYLDREYKYKHITHAEINALNFLSYLGRTAEGFILYTSFPCCPSCAEEVCEAGVERIVSPSLSYLSEPKDDEWVKHWTEQIRISTEIVTRQGVEWDTVNV